MKSFTELNEMANTIQSGYETSTVTDATVKSTLGFFAEVKYTCEQYTGEGMIYEGNDGKYNVRLLRDLCNAGLNYAGNTKMLKARFYSVWQQINSIVYG